MENQIMRNWGLRAGASGGSAHRQLVFHPQAGALIRALYNNQAL